MSAEAARRADVSAARKAVWRRLQTHLDGTLAPADFAGAHSEPAAREALVEVSFLLQSKINGKGGRS